MIKSIDHLYNNTYFKKAHIYSNKYVKYHRHWFGCDRFDSQSKSIKLFDEILLYDIHINHDFVINNQKFSRYSSTFLSVSHVKDNSENTILIPF